jgi:hypothetical protein
MPVHLEYRQLWIDAGYKSDMASAIAVKPPKKGFRAAYHFTKTKHALSSIDHRQIKVTRISETNDPFEYLCISVGYSHIRHAMDELRKNYDSKFGVLCFSQDWQSPALWGHYAERHHGICLGFHAEREKVDDVSYEPERVVVDLKNSPFQPPNEILEKLKYTKSRHWSYEEEIRREIKLDDETIASDDKRFFKFDETLRLAEVILGCNCSLRVEDVRARVRDAKLSNVTVYKARPAWKFFAMVPKECTVP